MTNAYLNSLPNGRKVYLDGNGVPLASGSVYYYLPGTMSIAVTYSDYAGTTPNPNPIVLDANGSCQAYASGQLREMVFTAAGQLVSDTVVSASTINTVMLPFAQSNSISAALTALGVTALQSFVQAPSTGVALQNLGVSSTMQSWLTQTSLTAGLSALLSAGIITTAPSVTHQPTNNPISTLGTMVLQATSTSAATRQFLASFNFTSNSGTTVSGADRVAVYAATLGTAGSSDVWSVNSLTAIDSTFPTTQNALGYELDYNNNCQNRGGVDGIAGFSSPTYKGLLVTGSSTYTSTAGIAVEGDTSTQWYRGVSVNTAVSLAAYADYTSATTGIEMQASHPGWGIDMNGSVFSGGGAVRLPNNTGIFARNPGGTADLCALYFDTAGGLNIGQTSAGGNRVTQIYTGANLQPAADNTFSCGTGSLRWTNIYAVNGVIQTSDPALKKDIEGITGALAIVDRLRPVTYRWRDGGATMQPQTVVKSVPATEAVTITHHTIQADSDGKHVKKPVILSHNREIWDEVPVHDADGKPIVAMTKDGCAAPEVHRVRRMVAAEVVETVPVSHEGQRTHWGFLASNVKEAFDAVGKDFAGYIKDEFGTEHLRYSDLIAVLASAIQELHVQVQALK